MSIFLSEIPILSSNCGLISITAESKNSPRCIDLDASTPDASGELKGVDLLSQPGKNGGPLQNLIQVQSIIALHLHVPVEVVAAATIGY